MKLTPTACWRSRTSPLPRLRQLELFEFQDLRTARLMNANSAHKALPSIHGFRRELTRMAGARERDEANRAAHNPSAWRKNRAPLAPAVRGPYSNRALRSRPEIVAIAPSAHRLAVQDVALSRRKHGFESRWARQGNQRLSANFPSICPTSVQCTGTDLHGLE